MTTKPVNAGKVFSEFLGGSVSQYVLSPKRDHINKPVNLSHTAPHCRGMGREIDF